MYKVLLVDDEPLVLSGIKIMANWDALDCELIGTARNGEQALAAIREQAPDIVFADINMPVMDGIALLCRCAEKYPHIVFVMLTNLEEFSLAQSAIKYKAVDYLIKTQLDQSTLEATIKKAKQEVDQRRERHQLGLVKSYVQTGKQELLKTAAQQIMHPEGVCPEALQVMQQVGVTNGYLFVQIFLDYPDRFSPPVNIEHISQLHLWAKEIVEEVSSNCFSDHTFAPSGGYSSPHSLLVWGKDAALLKEELGNFDKKIGTALKTLTGVTPFVLATELMVGTGSLVLCREQMGQLQNEFYNTGAGLLYKEGVPFTPPEAMLFSGAAKRLQTEAQAKNRMGVASVFERLVAQIKTTPHEKQLALWLCGELVSAAATTANATPFKEDFYWLVSEDVPRCIQLLLTRQEVAEFLQLLQKEYDRLLQTLAARGSDVLGKVHQYVQTHIEERIMLQDIAKEVSLTPTYLSALYKKQYGENLVEYINRTKMERACELIALGEYQIGQIGYMLGFENSYYFSRVFKRHTGTTPSEYAKKLHSKGKNHVE